MASRVYVNGFETGAPGVHAPSNSAITVQSDVVRTGTYALKVAVPASTTANLQLEFNVGSTNRSFFRGYLRIEGFPSGNLAIARWGSGSISGYLTLFLRPDGRLALGERTNILATGTTTLTPGAWHCVEVAYGCDNTTNIGQLRLDGVTEIEALDLSSTGQGPRNGHKSIYIGALNSLTQPFTCYWDDLAVDRETWCDPGRVHRVLLQSVTSDTGGITVQGTATSAVDALNTLTDDAWVSVPGGTNAHRLLFSLAGLPPSAVQVRGMAIWRRWRSESTTAHRNFIRRELGVYDSVASGTDQTNSTTYAWNVFLSSDSPVRQQLTLAEVNDIRVGLQTSASLSGSGRVSALVVELDVDERKGAKVHPTRLFIASCDTGDRSEFSGGSAYASTTRVRTGTYSLRCDARSSSDSAVEFTFDGAIKVAYYRFYLWFDQLPPVGQHIRILHIGGSWFNVHRDMAVELDGGGRVRTIDRISASPWTPAGVTMGRWVRFEVCYQLSNADDAPQGRTIVRVDGETVIDRPNAVHDNTFSGTISVIGVHSKSGNFPVDAYLDDVVVDGADWVGESRLLDLVPTGPGSITGTDWSAGPDPAAPRWEMLDESPPDNEGSYVVSAAASNDVETYALRDLPAAGVIVQAVRLMARYRCWPAANIVAVNWGVRVNNLPGWWASHTIGYSTSWTMGSTFLRTSPWHGLWTIGMVNGMEFQLRSNTNGQRFAVSNVRAVVEYVEAGTEYAEVVADAIVGGGIRKAEVRASGYVDLAIGMGRSVVANAVVIPGTPPQVLASRWYITNQSPTYSVGAAKGDWDVTHYAQARKLSSQKAGIASLIQHTKTALVEQRVLALQAISDPIHAQLLQGSLAFTFMVTAIPSNAIASTHVHVWVTKGDSADVRGVLLDNWTSDARWPSTPLGVAITVAENITPVQAQTGDRIVVEIGFYERTTTVAVGRIWYGGTGTTDLEPGSTDISRPGHIDIGGAIQKDQDTPSPVENGAETEAMALVIASRPIALASDALLALPVTERSTSLLADGWAVHRESRSCMAGALVGIERGAAASADGWLIDSASLVLPADAWLVRTQEIEVETSGWLVYPHAVSVAVDGWLVGPATLPLAADGWLIVAGERATSADAIVAQVQLEELLGDGAVQHAYLLEVDGAALVRDQQERSLDASAVIESVQDSALTGDAIVSGDPGAIRMMPRIIEAIVAQSVVPWRVRVIGEG